MPCRKVTCCSASRQDQCCCYAALPPGWIAQDIALPSMVHTLLVRGAVLLLHSYPLLKHLLAEETSQPPGT